MNGKTKDKIDFALFCLWFFTVGWAYYSSKILWHSMTPKEQLRAMHVCAIGLTPLFFVALALITSCPPKGLC